jgi:prefoldin subunit 5
MKVPMGICPESRDGMKLFSFGGKKKQVPVMPSPTDRVITLSSQGLSEPEIIQTLREEGYTPVQVDNAMTEALRGAAAGGPPAQPRPRQYPQREYPPQGYGPPARRPAPRPLLEPQPDYDEFANEEPEQPMPGYQPGRMPPGQGLSPEPPVDFEEFKRTNKDLGFPEIPGREEELPEEEMEQPITRFPVRDRTRGEMKQEKRRMIEELTEGVVEEKWSDFRKRVDDMNDRFQQLNERISTLEQKIGQAQGEKKSDLLEIEGKIDTYKQTMDEVESRMESVERAMKDSLTPMMQTLRSLSDTIKSLKERKV